MPKYIVQVTEDINHVYMIEADTEEKALEVYYSYTCDQLKALDEDGQASWDAIPWDVTEIKETQ